MKNIDEAIQHCEEVAYQQNKLKTAYDAASGYTRSGNESIRTDDAKRCEKCAADHRQLAEWLQELKRYKEQDKPQGEWISTKDKLPDNETYVLTTIKVSGRRPHVRSGWYQNGHFLNDNGDVWNDTDMEVVGWQYQPEPMGKEQE